MPVWPFEALQGDANGSLDVAFGDAGAEVHQQLAHVGVALLDAFVDLRQLLARRLDVARASDLLSICACEVEERERLRDRVVQLLREQVALLGDRELLSRDTRRRLSIATPRCWPRPPACAARAALNSRGSWK